MYIYVYIFYIDIFCIVNKGAALSVLQVSAGVNVTLLVGTATSVDPSTSGSPTTSTAVNPATATLAAPSTTTATS